MVSPAVKTGQVVLGQVLGNAGNSAVDSSNYTLTQDQASATNAAPESAAIGTQAVQALPESNQKANIGLDQAAQIESELATPVGAEIKQTGLDTTKQASDLVNQTKNDYHAAVQGAIHATLNAEDSLNQAAQKAAIDPQAYLNKMGVDSKVMTSIGMVLSGMGAGLTGQPNLAVDLYQKNLDRAINAQAQVFKNMMEVAASKQGLIKTAQDKQAIAATAYNGAVASVATGANVALQGLQTQVNGATAMARKALLENINNQKLSQFIDSHSKDFSSTVQSGNTEKVNLMTHILKPFIDHITGTPSSPASQGVSPADRIGRGLTAPGVPGVSAPSGDADFKNQLQQREKAQAAREQAIMNEGTDNKSGTIPTSGFLSQYGDK